MTVLRFLLAVGVPIATLAVGIALSKWFGWADQPPQPLTDKELPPLPAQDRIRDLAVPIFPDHSPGQLG